MFLFKRKPKIDIDYQISNGYTCMKIDLMETVIKNKRIGLKKYKHDVVEFYYDGYFIFYVDRFLSMEKNTIMGSEHKDVTNNILLIGISAHFRKQLTQKFYDELINKSYYNNSITILNIFITEYDLGIVIHAQPAYSILTFIVSVQHSEYVMMMFLCSEMIKDKHEIIRSVNGHKKRMNNYK